MINKWQSILDEQLIGKVFNSISTPYYPSAELVFKAFKLCDYYNTKVVFLGEDPYPQPNIATGVLFGNSNDTPEDKLSPSLKVIKESISNLCMPQESIIFDNSLESWSKQGILMLNSSLTVAPYKVGSHLLLWRPVIADLLRTLSNDNPGLIYVLFGNTAKSFKPCINTNDTVLTEYHPAYYARQNKEMPSTIFREVNRLLKLKYNETINWFKK